MINTAQAATGSNFFQRFRRSDAGGVAIVFSLTSLVIIGAVGLAIDGARAYHAASRVGAALDSSALAAAKARNEQGLDDGALTAYAKRYFDNNVAGTGSDPTDYNNFSVTVGNNGSVTVAVDTSVTTYFGGLFSTPKFDFTRQATAIYNIRDIELALMLDITGSMCSPCSKINDLKSASRDLVDILLENAPNPAQKVRIGIAPYSAAVNAGPAAALAVDPNLPRDRNCVIERTQGNIYSDDAPAPGAYFASADPANLPADIDPTEGAGNYFCPDAEVLPLTTNPSAVRNTINSLNTGGWTSGHIGLSWAWNILSDEWAGVWPNSATPAAYNNAETIKAVLMMTDGVFNTAYAIDKSSDQAVDLCSAMKAKGVVVFAVAFRAPVNAANMLRDCRTPDGGEFGQTFFDAQNGTQLRQAFASIATQLNTLRLAQ